MTDEKKPFFHNAQIDDEVFCVRYGAGHIIEIKSDSIYPIRVKYKNDTYVSDSYTLDGFYTEHLIIQSLFWTKPVIEPQTRPRRMETKIIEFWTNIYYSNEDEKAAFYNFPSEEEAHLSKGMMPNEYVKTIKTTTTIEVEE